MAAGAPAEDAAMMYSDIAIDQKKAGATDGAKKTLALAVEKSEDLDLQTRPAALVNALTAVAQAQFEVSVIDRATPKATLGKAAEAAKKVENPEQKVYALSKVARAQIALKQGVQAEDTLKEAEALAKTLTDPQGKTLGLLSVARAYGEANNSAGVERLLGESLSSVDSISTDGLEGAELEAVIKAKVECLASIGLAQARLAKKEESNKSFNDAETLAGQITDPLKLSNALLDIGEKLIDAGRPASGQTVLEKAKVQAQKVPGSIKQPVLDKIERAFIRIQNGG